MNIQIRTINMKHEMIELHDVQIIGMAKKIAFNEAKDEYIKVATCLKACSHLDRGETPHTSSYAEKANPRFFLTLRQLSRSYSVSAKKETSFFVLRSTFRNFAARNQKRQR